MRDHDISQRLACRLVGVVSKTVRREHPPDNPEIRKEMKVVAAKRRRFGYRRIGVMLEGKGVIMNHKKLYRLYTEEKLAVCAHKLGYYANQLRGSDNKNHHACAVRLDRLKGLCDAAIAHHAEAVWRTPDRMRA